MTTGRINQLARTRVRARRCHRVGSGERLATRRHVLPPRPPRLTTRAGGCWGERREAEALCVKREASSFGRRLSGRPATIVFASWWRRRRAEPPACVSVNSRLCSVIIIPR